MYINISIRSNTGSETRRSRKRDEDGRKKDLHGDEDDLAEDTEEICGACNKMIRNAHRGVKRCDECHAPLHTSVRLHGENCVHRRLTCPGKTFCNSKCRKK